MKRSTTSLRSTLNRMAADLANPAARVEKLLKRTRPSAAMRLRLCHCEAGEEYSTIYHEKTLSAVKAGTATAWLQATSAPVASDVDYSTAVKTGLLELHGNRMVITAKAESLYGKAAWKENRPEIRGLNNLV